MRNIKIQKPDPAAEAIDKIIMRLNQPFTYYYFILADNITVGAIRVVDKQESGTAKQISPIFIMPEYRNRICTKGDTFRRRKTRKF